MSRYVALLRAVNVGGKNRVPMADLRALAISLGHSAVETLIQSGNLIFDARTKSASALEKTLERAIADRFAIQVDCFVRDAAQLQCTIEANPFLDAAAADPAHLLVMFLRNEPTREALASLQDAIAGKERIAVVGRELFVTYPTGIGTSKLTGSLIERKLGVRGTARNWNIVNKLLEKCGSSPG